jgi:hypothetical protein
MAKYVEQTLQEPEEIVYHEQRVAYGVVEWK